jgi:hypothetical protein
MTTSTVAKSPWRIRSCLSGRLRVFHPGLSDSPGLRRHCAGVLHRTHWLLSHRINGLSGTLVLRFPSHEQDQIDLLLNQCFVDPFGDSSLETILSSETSTADIVRSSTFRSALRTGVSCGSILLIDSMVALPPLGMAVAATMFSFPLLREFWSQIRERWLIPGTSDGTHSLPPASVEVALSATLISSGLPQELLVETFLGSTTSALQSLTENTDGSSLELFDFLERLKTSVFLSCQIEGTLQTELIAIGAVQVGQRYELNQGSHVYLESRLLDGELVVLNSLADGSTLPFMVVPGDIVPFGCTVLHGSAVAEVAVAFVDVPAFQIQTTLFEEESLTKYQQTVSSLYRFLVPPIQLGLAAWSLFNGLTERAIGVLSFNPSEATERSKLSSAETALLDMRLNQVHIADVRALKTLSDLSVVLISIDALHYFGSYTFSEVIPSASPLESGDLIRILSSVAEYLKADKTTVFWGILESQLVESWSVDHLEINSDQPNRCWYDVQFSNGYSSRIWFCMDGDDISIRYDQKSELHGSLSIRWVPDPSYPKIVQQLESLNVTVQVVGSHTGRLPDPQDRQNVVANIRKNGRVAAYLGNVINDIPAMASADVAIGFEEDPQGFISKTVCDVILAGDISWLPRLIALSRSFERSAQINANLIVGSSILLAFASFISTLNPLQLIILFNAPPVIAELNTMRSLNSNCSRV